MNHAPEILPRTLVKRKKKHGYRASVRTMALLRFT